MEARTPVRKPRTSTSDLLVWSENQTFDSPVTSRTPRSASRSRPVSDGVSKVVFGGQVTDDEAESLNKAKPCSGFKVKEMSGSGIFTEKTDDDPSQPGSSKLPSNPRSKQCSYKAAAGISHISFGEEDGVLPKKPTTLPEVAKQRELSGTLETDSEHVTGKYHSDAKTKELCGHDIFAFPPEVVPRPILTRPPALKENIELGEPTSQNDIAARTSKKVYNQKLSELSGKNIFKEDVSPPTVDKHLSVAKLREMSGNDIFADGKVEHRDFIGGVRKPPGGDSTITLV